MNNKGFFAIGRKSKKTYLSLKCPRKKIPIVLDIPSLSLKSSKPLF